MITKHSEIFSNFAKLWKHLRLRRKIHLFLFLIFSLITAMAELISLGAVLPFLTALTNPEQLFNSKFMLPFLKFFSIHSSEEMTFELTMVFIIAVLLAGAMRMLQLWISTLAASSIGAELSIEVFRRTLYQPYEEHLRQNSSELISAIATKVPLVTNGTIFPFISLISALLILIAIFITLLVVDFVVSLSIFFGLGVIYFVVFLFTRSTLKNNGSIIAIESAIMIKTVQEGIGGIRDVKIENAQDVYLKDHASSVLALRKAQARNQFIGLSPRFGIEAVGIALIGVFAYFLVGRVDGLENGLPILGTIVFGVQRMLPALQTVYVSWSTIQGNATVASNVVEFLEKNLHLPCDLTDSVLTFGKEITIRDVYFRYSQDGPYVFKGVNLSIPKGGRVGLVGASGVGKSTLLDIIMGLVKPTKGAVLVDGTMINDSLLNSWQLNIAHVPQSVFLSDKSIKENIAFGVSTEHIDFERVKWAAKHAKLDAVVESWESKYDTLVGERGMRLSGGQLQRIGIARALYKKASFIVLDEATSALDLKTEDSIIGNLNRLSEEITILIVTHRSNSLKGCDKIYSITDGGSIKCFDNYEEFIDASGM